MIKAIFSLFFSLYMALIAPGFAAPEINGMKPEADPDFTPVLRFIASSDSHIKELGDSGYCKVVKMIKTGYEAAKADEAYPKLDAVIMTGDITDFGKPSSFFAFKHAVDNNITGDTDLLAVAAKNHDSYLGRISRSYISAITGDGADYHKVINGFHFIGLSPSPDLILHYSAIQKKWLDKQLAQAAADDPAKPIFVFQHEHIKGTVYGSLNEDGWGIDALTDVISKYPQVINISGHSHYPANDPRSIWQGGFTAINDGGLSYYEFTIDGQNSQRPAGSSNLAQALLVEIDAANRVKVRVCDLNAEAVTAEYMIDNVADTVKTKYAPEPRKEAAEAPAFDSALEISETDGKYTFTAKGATVSEDDAVFIYRFEITDASGNSVYSAKKLSNYYKSTESGDAAFDSVLLEPGSYTAKLIAEDVWGKQSAPLTAEFTVN